MQRRDGEREKGKGEDTHACMHVHMDERTSTRTRAHAHGRVHAHAPARTRVRALARACTHASARSHTCLFSLVLLASFFPSVFLVRDLVSPFLPPFLPAFPSQTVLASVDPDASEPLATVRLLAEHVSSPDESSEEALAARAQELASEAAGEAPGATSLALGAALSGLARSGRHGEVAAAANGQRDLGVLAAGVSSLLALRRVEAAERLRAAMASVDEDDALSQLAAAWVGLELGGKRVLDAFHAFQELGDRFLWTARLHAGLAVAHARAGRWDEATAEVEAARQKDPNDPDALANAAVTLLHAGDRDAAMDVAAQLRGVDPEHPLVARLDQAAADFDAAFGAQETVA